MEHLWDSDSHLVVAGDFVYLPLLLDPAIVCDLESHPPGKLPSSDNGTGAEPLIIEVQGSPFIRTVSLTSLLEQYAVIRPEVYEARRRALLEETGATGDPEPVFPDRKLAVILFQVLPHFLRRDRFFAREALDEEKILRMVSDRVKVPQHYARRGCEFSHIAEGLKEVIARLEKHSRPPKPPPAGLMPARRLRQWFFRALAAKIAAREKRRLAEAVHEQERWAAIRRRYAGLLAYLAEKGSLEMDGFGFTRRAHEYVVYKRTGPYALRDFYGRPYIFPDCRVAVSTSGRLKPFVIEHYKHPLLRRHGSGQEICMPRDFKPALSFSAVGVIRALEAGINALYYGYNPRRRNGYHSLDRIQQVRVVDFDDYKVPPDDPRIVSGEVEVKNIFF